MSKIKLIYIRIEAYEAQDTLSLYKKMGFELIDCQHYSGTEYRGEGCIQQVDYDYYECCFKFDMEEKNAKSRLKAYKKYLQKRKELSNKRSERAGKMLLTKAFLPITIILTLIIFPLIPMIFDYEFAEFISWRQDIFSIDKELDVLPLISSLILAPLAGICVSLILELIFYAFTFKRRRLKAADEIPTLEKELQDIICKIQNEDF